MSTKIERIKIDELELDRRNPRLAEFGIKASTPLAEVFQILWQNMSLEEIVTSLVAHGFFDTEPLIVMRSDDGKYVVLEGNRRLAAVKIVREPELVERRLNPEVLARINDDLVRNLETLPVIKVHDRQDAWRFIGFKHINGAAKWNSFAKAQHIVQVHNEFRIPLREIAFQVGDTHKTVQKLYQGMMVIEQAERNRLYSREDVKPARLYFSHLYTALQREGFKDYLSLNDSESETANPVPDDKLPNLKEVLFWLYGSKQENLEPVIKSQNPDLKRLEDVIQNREAISALRSGAPLEVAYELSRPKSQVFEESLFEAKRAIQNAWTNVAEGYQRGQEQLKVAGTIADIADDLFGKMHEMHHGPARPKKQRITEEE